MKGLKESLVTILILVVAGAFVRSLSHGEAVPLHRSLAEFPLHIGSWTGTEQGLDAEVLRVLRVDDYIFREYRREQGPPIGLYVGYYKSMRQGATYHSPKNCLPGSGWYFVETGQTDVRGPQEKPVTVNKFVIQKGLDRQLVLYWYQDRGRVITSEYWAKIYMVVDAIRKNRTDGAFVRITVPYTRENADGILRQGKAFAEAIFPILQAYLPS